MKTEIIHVKKLSESDGHELYVLFRRYYANTHRKRFLSDLSEKHWLIRMSDNGRLVGFSTQQLIEFEGNRFLFSGDTIVHPDYWNKSHLAGAFGHLFLRIAAQTDSPLYWFLISKGFRTYRFLPVFFNRFYPHHAENDAALKPLLDAVASAKFGVHYKPARGLIEFDGTKDYLSDKMADIPLNRQNDPHIAFFSRANPTYRKGTELACIALLSHRNLTACGRRVIESTEVEWHE